MHINQGSQYGVYSNIHNHMTVFIEYYYCYHSNIVLVLVLVYHISVYTVDYINE